MNEITSVAPTLTEIETARELVGAVVEVTPMQVSRSISEILGSPVLLKCENLQRTGAYKIRGAYNRLARLEPEERARGVVAAPAGNHAQGVALAARELGIRATIFSPVGVALPKLLATRGVEQGGLQLVAEKPGTHTHSYTHVHEDDHDHHHHDGDHDHSHPHEHEPAAKKKR